MIKRIEIVQAQSNKLNLVSRRDNITKADTVALSPLQEKILRQWDAGKVQIPSINFCH